LRPRRPLTDVDGDGRLEPAPTQDAAAFTLRRAAPDAVVDAVRQRVLEALGLDGALRADAPRLVDAHAVGGKELTRRESATASLEHPILLAVIRGSVQVVHVHPSASAGVEWRGGRPVQRSGPR